MEDKKEIADRMKTKFLIQVEYEFDEDSQGFKRQVKFLEDSDNIARIEIINLIRMNFKLLRQTIGNEIDDIIISMISDLLDEAKMEEMVQNTSDLFNEDGKMNVHFREEK